MSRYDFLVLTRAVTGTDEEFNRWYDQQHLADVLAVPGFVSARRFRILSSVLNGDGSPAWQYAAVYEMETEDPEATLAELYGRAGTDQMPLSDTLERATTATFLMRQISRRVR